MTSRSILRFLRNLTLKPHSEEKEFSRSLVMHLIESLEDRPLRHLTPNEHAHLLVLIQTTLEVIIVCPLITPC